MDQLFTPHPYRWYLHIFTVAYFTMSFVVRFAWPPVILLAAPELGIQMTGAGAYMSAFFLGYVITQIPGGLLGDRFGTRIVFFTALFIEGTGTLGVAFAPDFATGFAFRVLTGLGGGMVFASCVRYITTLFAPKEMGLAFGILLMAPSGVGVIVPNLLMPYLLSLFTWREAFRYISLFSFFMAFLALLLVRDNPVKQQSTNFAKSTLAVLQQKNILLIGFSGMWLIFVTVGFINWGNTYCQNLGFSRELASGVMLAFGIGGVVASPLGGMISARTDNTKTALMLGFCAMSPAFWFFSQTSSYVWLVTCSFCIGFIIGFINPFTTVLTARFAPKNSMGTAAGVTGCLYQCGALIAPTVMGLSIDLSGSFQTAWFMLVLAPFLGVLFAFFIRGK